MGTFMIRLFFAGPLRNVDYNASKEKKGDGLWESEEISFQSFQSCKA